MKLKLDRDSEARFGQDWRGRCLFEILNLMLGRDSEDEIYQDLCLNLRYELNPRVRCAFGNVSLFDCFSWLYYIKSTLKPET